MESWKRPRGARNDGARPRQRAPRAAPLLAPGSSQLVSSGWARHGPRYTRRRLHCFSGLRVGSQQDTAESGAPFVHARRTAGATHVHGGATRATNRHGCTLRRRRRPVRRGASSTEERSSAGDACDAACYHQGRLRGRQCVGGAANTRGARPAQLSPRCRPPRGSAPAGVVNLCFESSGGRVRQLRQATRSEHVRTAAPNVATRRALTRLGLSRSLSNSRE